MKITITSSRTPSDIAADLRRVCECGETFGKHGAAEPHTIGDTCAGFRHACGFGLNGGECYSCKLERERQGAGQ